MKLSAVIFDMDGVLVDTEPLMFDVFRTVFSPYGITLSDEYQYRFIGKPFADNLADIRRDFAINFEDHEIQRLFLQAYRRKLTAGPLYPQAGVLEMIEFGKRAEWKFALCTTTSRQQVEIVLAQLSLGGKLEPEKVFDAVVTGNDVTHKKPHPEPYLKAAQALGLPAEACLAVEDTETGAASAKAAGCLVAALRQPYNRTMDFNQADWVVDRLAELLERLR
ncbi:MAG: HAD family phosphatase [candidate division KSB1 bacterium]|nr:HAD family phosphatase [candidate division KSB1 bacterium]MDZ7346030.1 HAD family phosphatase [candidate division KSB1 bacterium]